MCIINIENKKFCFSKKRKVVYRIFLLKNMKRYRYKFSIAKHILSKYIDDFSNKLSFVKNGDFLEIELNEDNIRIYTNNSLILEEDVDRNIVYDFKGLGKKYSAAKIIKNMTSNEYIILSDNEDPKIGIYIADIIGSKLMVIGCFGNWCESINIDCDFDLDYIVEKITEYENRHSFPNPRDMYIQIPHDTMRKVPSKMWKLNYIVGI